MKTNIRNSKMLKIVQDYYMRFCSIHKIDYRASECPRCRADEGNPWK